MHEFDRVDRKILDILQRDGRISITDLAQQVGLSATPCAERVRRLERNGVIMGYHARVSPRALGKTLLVFLEINTQPGMTPTSLVPELGQHMGLSFGQLVSWLVEDASTNR